MQKLRKVYSADTVIILASRQPKTVETLHNCRNVMLKWKGNLTNISRRRPRLDCEDHTQYFGCFYCRLLIIDNFIPPDDKTKILARAEFDEEEDTWRLKALAKGGSVEPRLAYCSLCSRCDIVKCDLSYMTEVCLCG